MKCGRTGNLTTKKTKSHGITYEYYYVQTYIKETDKIEGCYLGRYDKLSQGYKDRLEQNPSHKNPAIHTTIHKPAPTQKSLNPAPFTELTQHTEAAVV